VLDVQPAVVAPQMRLLQSQQLLSSPKHLKGSLTLHVAEFQLTASRLNLTDVLPLEWCGFSIPAAAWLGTA
jgi:hypothetical protein